LQLIEIKDVKGQESRYDLDTPLDPRSPCLWEIYLTARSAVERTLAGAPSLGAASSACKQCVWKSACLAVLQSARDLTLLPELGRARRDALMDTFANVDELASANIEPFCQPKNKTDFKGVGAAMLRKFKARAQLACSAHPTPYLTQAVRWPDSPVELFFDIETDPMRDLCYLHGFVIRENRDARSERCTGIYADGITPAAEREAFAPAMAIFRQYPTAAVIHYSKYERTEYRKLQRKYPDVASAEEIEALFARPRALDLYLDVVKPGSEWPTLDFSIKTLAKFCGFSWHDPDPSGASSIEWFDQWVRTGDLGLKQRLLNYNEDDCLAMRVVMDGMRGFEVRVD
jgi:predicted RecB family nuclease